MQTFLINKIEYAEFITSFSYLDYKRLGNQRSEAKMILEILLRDDKNNRWYKHPAVQMWKGYEKCLSIYYNTCILAWMNRGYKNFMSCIDLDKAYIRPAWLDDERIFSSHRAALLYKNPGYYTKFNWKETPKIEYFWPTKNGY